MSRSSSLPVIIIGAGTTAHLTAQRIAEHRETLQIEWGCSTELPLLTQPAGQSSPIFARPDWTRIKAEAILHWSGQIGNFKLTIRESDGSVRWLSGGAVILALDGPTTLPSCLRSLPGESLQAFAREIGVSLFSPLISEAERTGTAQTTRMTGSHSIALLLGQSGMEASLSTALVLKGALKLRTEFNTEVQVLYPELAVAAGNLEKLYQEARDAGVRFYRYPKPQPPQVREEAGVKTLVFSDPLLPPDFPPLEITADRLVIAEEYLPAPEIKHLAELAGLAIDGEGFLGAEELPFWAGRTNRRGIYALGLLRGPARALDLLEELAAVEVDLNACLTNLEPNPAAQVDPQRCVICLTCYRVCPHRAVELVYAPGPVPQNKLNQQVAWIHPQACQACGTCIAECPAQAIRWADAPESNLSPDQELLLGRTRLYRVPAAYVPSKKEARPLVRLVALACINSGYLAFQNLTSTLPVFNSNVLEEQSGEIVARIKVQAVPCAGSLDVLTVLNLFTEGADGVLICACYPQACLHGNGPGSARRRWPVTRNYLQMLGWQDRVALVSLAGPNPAQLTDSLRQLALNIRDLGGGMVDNC